jgi:chromosome segregation ATPase
MLELQEQVRSIDCDVKQLKTENESTSTLCSVICTKHKEFDQTSTTQQDELVGLRGMVDKIVKDQTQTVESQTVDAKAILHLQQQLASLDNDFKSKSTKQQQLEQTVTQISKAYTQQHNTVGQIQNQLATMDTAHQGLQKVQSDFRTDLDQLQEQVLVILSDSTPQQSQQQTPTNATNGWSWAVGWSCPVCTYNNDTTLTQCEMCDGPKP